MASDPYVPYTRTRQLHYLMYKLQLTHEDKQRLSCQLKSTWITFEYTSGNKTFAWKFSWLVSNLPRTGRNFPLQKAMTDSPTGLTQVRYAVTHFKSEGSPTQAPKSENVITNRIHLLQKVKQQFFCEHGHEPSSSIKVCEFLKYLWNYYWNTYYRQIKQTFW